MAAEIGYDLGIISPEIVTETARRPHLVVLEGGGAIDNADLGFSLVTPDSDVAISALKQRTLHLHDGQPFINVRGLASAHPDTKQTGHTSMPPEQASMQEHLLQCVRHDLAVALGIRLH
jgi:hypothetical protein